MALFEMIRATHAHEQQALDQAVKSGQMTPEQYATESERLSYKYARQHHEIVSRMVADGQISRQADIFDGIQKQTEDEYILAQRRSGHWQGVLNRGRGIVAGSVDVQ